MIQVFSREFEGQTENCFKTVIFAVLFGAASGTKITRLKVKCVISTVILCWCCVNPPTFIASFILLIQIFFSSCGWLWPVLDRNSVQWTWDSGQDIPAPLPLHSLYETWNVNMSTCKCERTHTEVSFPQDLTQWQQLFISSNVPGTSEYAE